MIKMSTYVSHVIFYLFVYCLLIKVQGDVMVRKFVYQRDMSEHCRRRVMPSVFIGRHVVEANAQILHFSQLDVPYSCSTSVRTESGGYLILVIQIDDDEINCSEGSPVKIYEMSETFGGYWGPLPDTFLRRTATTHEHYYTLRTTTMEPVMETEKEESETELTTTPSQTTLETQATQGTYAIEFPLVNVTVRLEPSNEVNKGLPGDSIEAELDTFDRIYNVHPVPGVPYQTSIFPLMQFAIARDQEGGRRSEDSSNVTAAGSDQATNGIKEPDDDGEKRYVFDYDSFTVDPRLRYMLTKDTGGMWPPKRYPALANRLFNMKRHKGKNKTLFEVHQMNFSQTTEELPLMIDSFTDIETLLSKLTTNDSEQIKKAKSEKERFSALLERINSWQHNYSAYLSPNLTHDVLSFDNPLEGLDVKNSSINKDDTKISTENNQGTSTSDHYYLPSISEHVREESPTTIEPFEYSATQTVFEVTKDLTTKSTNMLKSTIEYITGSVTKITENIKNFGTGKPDIDPTSSMKTELIRGTELKVSSLTTTDNKEIKTTSLITSEIITNLYSISEDPGLLANRASWENVVHVAPQMAGILNHHLVTPKQHEKRQTSRVGRWINRRRRRRHMRRHDKRSIQAIPVDNARPHNLTTDPVVITTPELMYKFVDMQDFAQLVELQDDDIQGHIALRFIRNYVGNTLFDVCKERGKNQSNLVYLFNTSRIVISLANFSLRRMTIVATPARLMSMAAQRCSADDLECQVSGARVCVSNLTACDGVPNCGAYDIYDEDRLMCGVATGLQHNVYLAAFTFLAALLTILYTVHYWLKRCVPKVSEAFFIYTNGTENILYLESIMRSPLDVEINPIMPKPQTNDVYNDILDLLGQPVKRANLFIRIFRCCKKKKSEYVDLEMDSLDAEFYLKKPGRFSFTEEEICNLRQLTTYADTSAQTGDSLQMSDEGSYKASVQAQRRVSMDPRHELRDIRLTSNSIQSLQDNELQMLKFFRESKQSMEDWEDSGTSLRVMRGSKMGRGMRGEFELRNTILDSLTSDSLDLPSPTTVSQKTRGPVSNVILGSGPSSSAPKRLRFNENLMTISEDKSQKTAENEDDDSDQEPPPLVHESSQSGRRRGFWTSNKTKEKDKKTKKKQQTLKK